MTDSAKQILQQFITHEDVYVRERTHQLLSNTEDYGMVVQLGLTMRASPDNVSAEKLTDIWPVFDLIYRSGLPQSPLWNFFRRLNEKVIRNLPLANHVAKLRGRSELQGSITTLLALFIDRPAVYRALEEHTKNSYIYIPFDPLRHAYDFLTVVLPVALIDDDIIAHRNYDEILRGLRAIGLLFDSDNVDAFCAEFSNLMSTIEVDVLTHPGYEGKTVTNRDINNVLFAASKGYVVKRDKTNKLVTMRHPQTVSALIDVCRLMGLTGRDRAFFWFDILCGFSVHPSLRISTNKFDCWWYGVSWAVIAELNNAASERKLEIPKEIANEVIIWFNAKQDARHLMGEDIFCSVQTSATRNSRSFREVNDHEERERKIDEHRIVQWHETFHRVVAASDKRVSLQIVEYEPEYEFDDFLLVSVDLPTSSNYLEALVTNMGIYGCFQHAGSFTEEVALTTLACIFNNTTMSFMPAVQDSTLNFLHGLEDFLFAVTDFRCHNASDFSLDRVYEVYKHYCKENIEVLFSLALKTSAFHHLDEHQYLALKKLPSDSSEASRKLEHVLVSFVDGNTDIAVLQKAADIYRDRLDTEEGSRKIALLNSLKYLEKIVIPRAYKYDNVHLIETSMALFLAMMNF